MNIINELAHFLGIRFSGYSIQKAKSQRALIDSFVFPRDDIDRAYYHYRLLKSNMATFPWLLTEVYAALRFFLCLTRCSLRSQKASAPSELGTNAVLLLDEVSTWEDLLPQDIVARYGVPIAVPLKKLISSGCLTKAELRLIWQCFCRHPFCPKYLYQITSRLSAYRALLSHCVPMAILVFATEDCCAMSLLTNWCEERRITHIDFMHGDLLLGYLFAYSRYNDIYTWDVRYEILLRNAKVAANTWHVYCPSKFAPINRDEQSGDPMRIVYYFSGESTEICNRLKMALLQLKKKGYICVLRFHPRFSNAKLIREIFAGFDIEDPLITPLPDSLRNVKYAVSIYSSVLLQAYHSGIPIVIDDVSDPQTFALLKYIDYWGLSHKASLLSGLCNE